MRPPMKMKHPAAALALLLCFVFTVTVFVRIGRHFTDADMASEFVYADLLNREGSLHTGNWVYSSELRLVAPTPVYRLALSLFSDWHTARAVSNAILLSGVLACFLYMARALTLFAGGLLSACVFALPFAHVYAYFVTYGGHYSVHLMIGYLMLGMLLRAQRKEGFRRRLILCFLLSLWGGLGGVRLAAMFSAPMALSLLWECVFLSRGESARAALGRLPRRQLLCAFSILLGSATGLFFNLRVLSQRFQFDSHALTPVHLASSGEFFAHLWDFFGFFGLRESTRMLSARGIASLLAIALGCFCLFAVHRQIQRGAAIPAADRLMARFAACALILGFLVNLLTQNFGCQYYLFGLIAAVLSADGCLALAKDRPRVLMAGASAVLVCCFALESLVFVRQEMQQTPAAEELAAEWLLENGYTKGYATFWHGAPLTEAADGKIEIWVLEEPVYNASWRSLKLNDILQEKRHLTEDPEGAVFVYLYGTETENPPAWTRGDHLVISTYWGDVYAYGSAKELKAAAGLEGGT